MSNCTNNCLAKDFYSKIKESMKGVIDKNLCKWNYNNCNHLALENKHCRLFNEDLEVYESNLTISGKTCRRAEKCFEFFKTE